MPPSLLMRVHLSDKLCVIKYCMLICKRTIQVMKINDGGVESVITLTAATLILAVIWSGALPEERR
jgi:hypothetical protein